MTGQTIPHQIGIAEAIAMPAGDLAATIEQLRFAIANKTVSGYAYYNAAVSLRSCQVAQDINNQD